MKAYLDILTQVLEKWVRKPTRPGIDALTIAGAMFQHDMQEGFPLLTTKKVPFGLVASELEFFIKGITDKDRLRQRNNHIRDERCSPSVIPYSHDPEIQKKWWRSLSLGPSTDGNEDILGRNIWLTTKLRTGMGSTSFSVLSTRSRPIQATEECSSSLEIR